MYFKRASACCGTGNSAPVTLRASPAVSQSLAVLVAMNTHVGIFASDGAAGTWSMDWTLRLLMSHKHLRATGNAHMTADNDY